jgi:hypothetical protein
MGLMILLWEVQWGILERFPAEIFVPTSYNSFPMLQRGGNLYGLVDKLGV